MSAPAEEFIDAAVDEVEALRLVSDDPRMSFVTHTRRTEAKAGPALVVSIVAEAVGGERYTAVVASLVVHADAVRGDDRLARIRTHLEDQHTRHDQGRIEFEEHHEKLRASLVEAVLRVEPGAFHRDAPVEPDGDGEASVIGVPRAIQRPDLDAPVATSWYRPAVDGRSVAGVGLIGVGVVVMALAVSSGSLPTAVVGVVVALVLGWIGSRLHGS